MHAPPVLLSLDRAQLAQPLDCTVRAYVRFYLTLLHFCCHLVLRVSWRLMGNIEHSYCNMVGGTVCLAPRALGDWAFVIMWASLSRLMRSALFLCVFPF